jgi:hypothetical protein
MRLDLLFVDDHRHTALAVLSLAAEEPHGLLVLDGDGVGRNHALGHAGGDRHVARVDALDARVDIPDWHTRVVESRLCDCVVSCPELELDHGTGFSCNLLGPELEASCICCSIAAYSNDLNVDSLSDSRKSDNGNL